MVWHQFPLAFIFIISGIFHFIKPRLYGKVIPPYLPYHQALVVISGIAEITAGVGLCLFNSHRMAAWAIIGMLIIFLPIHINMLLDEKANLKLPKWFLILRFPIQFALIYWAFQYA